MKRITVLLTLLAPLWASTIAAPPSTNSASTNRVLMIDPSSMPVAAGKATLTIGALQRADGIYTGGYRINVSPYFYKNEKGKLNIVVSDESMAKISRGKVAAITGTATTSGQGGATRHIDATATPASEDHGTLKLWFMSGDRKMIFEPAYHFAEKGTPATLAQTNMNSNLKRRLPVTHREIREAAAAKRP
jgi:hypothetical protein